jgi:hypothetical protein
VTIVDNSIDNWIAWARKRLEGLDPFQEGVASLFGAIFERLVMRIISRPNLAEIFKAVPSFIRHGGGFGAPDRMKLGALMLLFARYNFAP